MTIVNIRGTSGSGKSTLVHRLLKEFPSVPVEGTFSDWKKPKIVAYRTQVSVYKKPVFSIGRYETQCGGCDSMSYKGSHDDIEALVRQYLQEGNVIFEGLTISSTLTRWRVIDEENPGQFVWAFMSTPEEECHQRILTRNGGKEPKRDEHGLADYQRKWRGCMRHWSDLKIAGRRTIGLTSDNAGYKQLLELLD